DIPIAPSLYSLSNKMDNSLLAVRDINHKYIVVDLEEEYIDLVPILQKLYFDADEFLKPIEGVQIANG
ncbi:MAG: hypothetical protein KH000_03530, partial [Coprococcus comes]|nr:hypothetical protein [Coprococcus comes]